MPDTRVLGREHKVRNVDGSGVCDLSGRSFKQYWLKHSGRGWPAKCSIYNCGNEAMLGGHVYVNNGYVRAWILPICYSCNNSGTETWDVKENVKVVEDDKADAVCHRAYQQYRR